MRVPSFDRLSRWLRSTGIFLIGMIVGSCVFLVIHHQSLNRMFTINDSLEKENKSLSEEIVNLNKYKNKGTTLTTIKVFFEEGHEDEALNEVTKNELKERIKKNLQVLIGRKVNTINDPELYRHLIGNRIYPLINDKDYYIKLSMVMAIYNELQVWVEAAEFKRN